MICSFSFCFLSVPQLYSTKSQRLLTGSTSWSAIVRSLGSSSQARGHHKTSKPFLILTLFCNTEVVRMAPSSPPLPLSALILSHKSAIHTTRPGGWLIVSFRCSRFVETANHSHPSPPGPPQGAPLTSRAPRCGEHKTVHNSPRVPVIWLHDTAGPQGVGCRIRNAEMKGR